MKERQRHRNANSGGSTRRDAPVIGMLEWFRTGDQDRVDRVVADMGRLGVKSLRTGISWADWHTPEGEAWYAWLFPQLSRKVEVVPCFPGTPPSWGVAPKTSAPPRNPPELRRFHRPDDQALRQGKTASGKQSNFNKFVSQETSRSKSGR